MIKIRLAIEHDIPAVMDIYAYARQFMARTGNPGQWTDGYPSLEILREDLRQGNSYVCEDAAGKVVGTFCFRPGPEPNYRVIYDGRWLNDTPYGVIHRLASDGTQRGLADECIAWCAARCPELRADTHRDNAIVQHILRKNGFVRCGTILVENGTPRIAFQRTLLSGKTE